nr:hypothetical protein [Vibrio coralliilyticus]
MSKLRQLDVFIGTNTKIGRLIFPVGTKTEFSFIYEEDWKHTGFPISPHIPFDDQSSPVFCYVDWESEDFQNPPKGNFQCPITSYGLAEFGTLLGFSGPKMASILVETVGAIKNAVKETIRLTEAQGIDKGEREHMELCASLIRTECDHWLAQADSVSEMSELV